MAKFSDCFHWVLSFEDSTLSGVVKDLQDGGGRTRFGIAETKHPNLPSDFYTCDNATALTVAEGIYRKEYWNRFCGDDLASDELAATLFSFSVNEGIHGAVELLQVVLGMKDCDGSFGPITLACLKMQDEHMIAVKLRRAQEDKYQRIAVADPSKVKFLHDWLFRATAVYTAPKE